jgi:hypothetical protein
VQIRNTTRFKSYICPLRILLKTALKIYNYFFLCVAQNLDFPTAVFLHFFPSFVFAAHFAFFACAIIPPCFDIARFYHIIISLRILLIFSGDLTGFADCELVQ